MGARSAMSFRLAHRSSIFVCRNGRRPKPNIWRSAAEAAISEGVSAAEYTRSESTATSTGNVGPSTGNADASPPTASANVRGTPSSEKAQSRSVAYWPGRVSAVYDSAPST